MSRRPTRRRRSRSRLARKERNAGPGGGECSPMTGGAPRARLAARGVQDDGKTGCADHTIPRGQLPGGQLLLRQHLHKLRTAVRSLLVGTKRSSLEPAAAGRCHACSLSSQGAACVSQIPASTDSCSRGKAGPSKRPGVAPHGRRGGDAHLAKREVRGDSRGRDSLSISHEHRRRWVVAGCCSDIGSEGVAAWLLLPCYKLQASG